MDINTSIILSQFNKSPRCEVTIILVLCLRKPRIQFFAIFVATAASKEHSILSSK